MPGTDGTDDEYRVTRQERNDDAARTLQTRRLAETPAPVPAGAANTSLSQPGLPAFLSYDSYPARPAVHHRRHSPGRRPRREVLPTMPPLVFVPHWDQADGHLWDEITLDGISFAGTVKISGEGPSRDLDTRRARGRRGHTTRDTGPKAARFEITLQIWTEEHLDDFARIAAAYHPHRVTDGTHAVAVYHPALALALVDQVVIETFGFLTPASTHGLFTCALKVRQYMPPRTGTTGGTVTRPQRVSLADVQNGFPPVSDNPNTVTPPSRGSAGP